MNSQSPELHHRSVRQNSSASTHQTIIENEGRTGPMLLLAWPIEFVLIYRGQLENEWNDVIEHWSTYRKKKSQQIKVNIHEEIRSSSLNVFFSSRQELIRTGVPAPYRPLLWQCLTNVEQNQAKDTYGNLIKLNSPCDKVIRRDITRTYPEHDLFKEQHGLGQESLFNVIKVRSSVRPLNRCERIEYRFVFRPIHCMTVKWAIVKALAF